MYFLPCARDDTRSRSPRGPTRSRPTLTYRRGNGGVTPAELARRLGCQLGPGGPRDPAWGSPATRPEGPAGGGTCLQGQVGVLLLLSDLQARQVGVAQGQLVPVLEVLGHRALHRLPALLLQREPGGAKSWLRPRGPRGPRGQAAGTGIRARSPAAASSGQKEGGGVEPGGKPSKSLPGAQIRCVLWVIWNTPELLTFQFISREIKDAHRPVIRSRHTTHCS